MASPLTNTIITEVGEPARTIYVYGQIVYKDIFNKERHTRYRFIYGGPYSARMPPPREMRLMPDAEGNEAD